MIPAMLAAFSVTSPSMGDHAPSWYDQKLAGYLLLFDERHDVVAVSDPKSGYFLVRSAECDGALLSLVLTRDRKMVSEMGFKVPNYKTKEAGEQKILIKPIPSLSTGKGVTIGDSPDQVRQRLGPPTKTKHTGGRKQFVELVYTWKSGKGEDETDIEETYTFKGGKLIEIEFFEGAGV